MARVAVRRLGRLDIARRRQRDLVTEQRHIVRDFGREAQCREEGPYLTTQGPGAPRNGELQERCCKSQTSAIALEFNELQMKIMSQ